MQLSHDEWILGIIIRSVEENSIPTAKQQQFYSGQWLKINLNKGSNVDQCSYFSYMTGFHIGLLLPMVLSNTKLKFIMNCACWTDP